MFEFVSLLDFVLPLNADVHSPDASQGLWATLVETNTINVLIMGILIGWLLNHFKVGQQLDAQRQAVHQELEEAEALKASARSDIKHIQSQMDGLAQETDSILNQARQAAGLQANQIIETAQYDADKLLENVKKRLELEQQASFNRLKERYVEELVESARAELSQSMTTEQHQERLQSVIHKLPAQAPFLRRASQ